MEKFKNYEQFNESMADFFKSAHAAIDPEELISLEDLIGQHRFPSQEEFDEAVDYLEINSEHLYYNPKDIISPIMYWDGPIYEPFHGGLNMEALKMMRTKERLERKIEDTKKWLNSKDYDSLFSRMDKKILIPSFIKMYDEIPDKDKYEIFKDLYVRSEYGFQSFPLEVITDCFAKRKLSPEWKKRLKSFNSVAKKNSDGTITLYRGENVDSAKSDDAFSWTLNKKTAKFFADRFSKGSGRITEKNIDPKEVIDYFDDRGESEVILFPRKFGILKESQRTRIAAVGELRMDGMLVRLNVHEVTAPGIYPHMLEVEYHHPNMGKVIWFEIDENGNFTTETTASEFFIFEKFLNYITNPPITHRERVGSLMEWDIFTDWIESCKEKYRIKLTATKYGL